MKFLKLIFIIFILVIAGELGYYLYITSVINYSGKTNPQQINFSPRPTLSKDFVPAIHPDQIKDLSLFVNNTRTSEKYYLTIENEGILTDLNQKGKKVGSKIFPLGLKIKSGQADDWYWLSPTFYELLQVFILNNGSFQKASLSDLKIGDHIITQQMTNLAYPPFDPRSPHSFIIKIIK